METSAVGPATREKHTTTGKGKKAEDGKTFLRNKERQEIKQERKVLEWQSVVATPLDLKG